MARASALLVPMMMPNAIAGNISMEFNAKGVRASVSFQPVQQAPTI